uniref:Uncharacterized protein n=1 Tax=Faxonius propinquus nudivirus TaxID=3139431 RepID=A0AAU8GBH8_9VIRU
MTKNYRNKQFIIFDHENYKSIAPSAPSRALLHRSIDLLIRNQFLLSRTCPTQEKHLWRQRELDQYNINIDNITEVYHYYNYDDRDFKKYYLLAKLKSKHYPLYMEIDGWYDTNDRKIWGGCIYFCLNKRLYKNTVRDKNHTDKMDILMNF